MEGSLCHAPSMFQTRRRFLSLSQPSTQGSFLTCSHENGNETQASLSGDHEKESVVESLGN